jgi:hypothetical protein
MISRVRNQALIRALVLVSLSSPSWAEYGRTQGVFEVAQGSATYTIPIRVPPGPNGVQPSIAVPRTT